MNATKTCEFCNTTLEYEIDGQRMAFTAHDEDFCKQSARYHKMIIEDYQVRNNWMLKQNSAEMARMQTEVHELRKALEEVLGYYETAADDAGPIREEAGRIAELRKQFLR